MLFEAAEVQFRLSLIGGPEAAQLQASCEQPEEVAKDMIEHALPGVIIVPSLAAALALLQGEGHYSYMAA